VLKQLVSLHIFIQVAVKEVGKMMVQNVIQMVEGDKYPFIAINVRIARDIGTE
jgi:hypothetical protein